MWKSMRLVAVAVLLSLAVEAAPAWASTPAPDETAAAPAPAAAAPSIRASLEKLRQSPPVVQPARRAPSTAEQSGSGGRHMNNAAKAAIWIAAATVTSVWAYKTFSVTRGTD